jgi:nicotinamidase-related amidase
VIDLQNAWLEMSKGLEKSTSENLEYMKEAISIFHRAGAPIIFTYQSFSQHGVVSGTKEFELLPGITATAEDGKIVKAYSNAFNKTELTRMIQDKGCDTVFLIGLSALHCVLSTYLAAYDEGFSPYIVKGAVAGTDEESIKILEKICDTLSLRAISQILGLKPNMH